MSATKLQRFKILFSSFLCIQGRIRVAGHMLVLLCVCVLWVYLCMCVLPNKNSSLLSSCRFSKDSWVGFRSWSRSQVRHWSRWPLVVRPPSNSCQINQSCWVVWRAWHTSPPRTLSFCLSSSCPLSFTHTCTHTYIQTNSSKYSHICPSRPHWT